MIQSLNKMRQDRQSMRGMSLPEILAAVLIGLIGMIVIMQVYATSEERKRTTTGTSDAQINGNIALFTLENAIRSAGFGMVSANNNMLGCTTRAAYNNIDLTPFLMAPVRITAGAAGAPDSITVIAGSSPTLVEGSAFVAGAASGADFPLKNAAGFLAGDLVVASQSGLDCSLAEITGFLPAAVNTIQHAPNATYNKAPGLGVDYSSTALLFSLGRSPSVVTYQIGNDKLQTDTLIPHLPTPTADVGDGIVQLKTLYGKDTSVPSNGVVDTWDIPPTAAQWTATPWTAAQWKQVIAVRIALLARSAKFEKTAVTDSGAGTAPAPTWNGGTAFVITNPADGTDWHRYRYRVYETVVPLRNLIWSN